MFILLSQINIPFETGATSSLSVLARIDLIYASALCTADFDAKDMNRWNHLQTRKIIVSALFAI